MSETVSHYTVRIFYEDTDHSGVVYHANYLKYFERAREDYIGYDRLKDLWNSQGLGFAVYRADIRYHDGAVFGDVLDIRTSVRLESEYRALWHHEAWREGGRKPAVTADIELVCINREKKLQMIPTQDLFLTGPGG
ncbi:MAG: YbgC/FadM family acyl-CoA thioesterase [Pseudomonadota bacterium]